jgi:N-acylglucosamine-6-phosphate 2-epimerase
MFPSGIITSIQPHPQSAFNDADGVVAFALECSQHSVALRIEGRPNIKMVASVLVGYRKAPIIGLIKTKQNALNTIITSSHSEAIEILEFGANYVAMECTGRCDLDRIQEAVETGISVIADIADLEHAKIAEEIGCTAITTALSGYINETTHPFVEPDIALVEKCVKEVKMPVIAEGRYWTPRQIGEARDAGAYAVCVGNAITNPKMITLHNKIVFDNTWQELVKNDYRDLEYTR